MKIWPLLLLGLLLMGATTSAGGLPVAYPPGSMPANLAAYELADEPDYAAAKLATLRFRNGNSVCSATAVGHHRVLTAYHCVEGGIADVRMDTRTANITHVEYDGHDAVILTTDIYFTHVASYGPRPLQGDMVFSHGNPAGTPDILLVGRVAGWVNRYNGSDNVMLLDRNDWYGCSGAAVFDRNGKIVGIVNAIFPWPNKGWRLTAVYPLTFTPEQLAG
jgi:hypothetical protein